VQISRERRLIILLRGSGGVLHTSTPTLQLLLRENGEDARKKKEGGAWAHTSVKELVDTWKGLIEGGGVRPSGLDLWGTETKKSGVLSQGRRDGRRFGMGVVSDFEA